MNDGNQKKYVVALLLALMVACTPTGRKFAEPGVPVLLTTHQDGSETWAECIGPMEFYVTYDPEGNIVDKKETPFMVENC